MRVVNGVATLRTHNGHDWTGKLAAIAEAASKLSDAIIGGETFALDDTGHPSFA